MNVYIIYSVSNFDEEYYTYWIGTNRKEAKQNYNKAFLEFFKSAPDPSAKLHLSLLHKVNKEQVLNLINFSARPRPSVIIEDFIYTLFTEQEKVITAHTVDDLHRVLIKYGIDIFNIDLDMEDWEFEQAIQQFAIPFK